MRLYTKEQRPAVYSHLHWDQWNPLPVILFLTFASQRRQEGNVLRYQYQKNLRCLRSRIIGLVSNPNNQVSVKLLPLSDLDLH